MPTFPIVAQLERLAGLIWGHFTDHRDVGFAVEIHPGHTSIGQLECLRALRADARDSGGDPGAGHRTAARPLGRPKDSSCVRPPTRWRAA